MSIGYMIKLFEDRGFAVDCARDNVDTGYRFTIYKHNNFITDVYKGPCDWRIEIRQDQRAFVESLINRFEKEFEVDLSEHSGYIDTDICTVNYRNAINRIYGLTSAEVSYRKYCDDRNKERRKSMYAIKNVIFNDPATIVFWADGTKTVVKAQDGDIFDPEKGLAMAISKKALGNKGNYCDELKKWLPKEETLGPCTMSELEESLRKLGEVISKTPFPIPKLDSEAKYNPVQKAYDILVGWRDGKVPVSIDEVIGYLGEALDD